MSDWAISPQVFNKAQTQRGNTKGQVEAAIGGGVVEGPHMGLHPRGRHSNSLNQVCAPAPKGDDAPSCWRYLCSWPYSPPAAPAVGLCVFAALRPIRHSGCLIPRPRKNTTFLGRRVFTTALLQRAKLRPFMKSTKGWGGREGCPPSNFLAGSLRHDVRGR